MWHRTERAKSIYDVGIQCVLPPILIIYVCISAGLWFRWILHAPYLPSSVSKNCIFYIGILPWANCLSTLAIGPALVYILCKHTLYMQSCIYMSVIFFFRSLGVVCKTDSCSYINISIHHDNNNKNGTWL